MSESTLPDVLRQTLSAVGDRCFISVDAGICTGTEFQHAVDARARDLLSAGIKAGDRVMVASRRGLAFWRDLAAVWSARASVVPYDGLEPQSRERLFQVSRSSLILDREILSARASSADTIGSSAALTASDAQIAAILFTSGSTGVPKGVVLTHKALLLNAGAFATRVPLNSQDKLAIAIPFHFTSAICHFIACLISGAQLVGTERRLLPADLIAYLHETRATCFGGAPMQLKWITQGAPGHCLSLRWVMSSGDHLPPAIMSWFAEEAPSCRVYAVYGLTEVGARFCVLSSGEAVQHPGSVGTPIPGLTFTIRDEANRLCAPGEVGEVHVRGSSLMCGYFDDGAQGKTLAEHGFPSGDLGHVDNDGYLYLVGRRDDVFKVSGQKVSALRIQEATLETGLCEDAAVIPIDDAILGTVPVLYYVPLCGATFTVAELLSRLRDVLPQAHLPRRMHAVCVIPRTGSGKVQRAALRALEQTSAM